MVKQYRKKPVVIEALQWTGDNLTEILEFCPDCFSYERNKVLVLTVSTLEGNMKASINDFIIKGVHDEFYACKPSIFEKTYEQVTDQ